MEVIGNLIKKVEERSGNGQNGPWRIAYYLIDIVDARDSFSTHRKMVVEVWDGESGRISKFDGLFGKDVVVRFDIDAREYQGRWYNQVKAYGIREHAIAADAAGTVAGEGIPSADAQGAVVGNERPAADAAGTVTSGGDIPSQPKSGGAEDKLPF